MHHRQDAKPAKCGMPGKYCHAVAARLPRGGEWDTLRRVWKILNEIKVTEN